MSNNFKTESPPPLPIDPNLAQAQADAKEFKTRTLQDQLRGDSASIMARYGTNLTLASSQVTASPSPAASAPDLSPFGGMAPFVGGFIAQNKGILGG